MTYMDKKQLNNRRSSVRNTLKAEKERALGTQRAHALETLLRRKRMAEEVNDRKKSSQGALLHSTADLAHKVLGAFGVDVPVQVEQLPPYHGSDFKAYTDFKRIYVSAKTEGLNFTDFESVAKYVFTIKGAVYHEGGHILYTFPFMHLLEKIQTSGATDEIRDRARRLREVDRGDQQLMQRSWNIIEDQRMEMAMVTVSPVLANYYTATALNVVVNHDDLGGSWPYVTGRLYLPYDLRKSMRKLAKKHNAALVPLIDSAVARYRVARTDEELFNALCDFHALMMQWGLMGTKHESEHQSHRFGSQLPKQLPDMDGATGYEDADDDEYEDSPDDSQGGPSQPQQPDAGEDDAGSQSGAGPDDSDGEDEDDDGSTPSRSNSPKPGNDNNGDINDGQAASKGNGAGRGQSDVQDMINDILESVKPTVNSDVRSFVTKVNEELSQELKRDPTAKPMDAESIAKAITIKGGIIGSLEHLLDQTNPSWRFRQEMGVLDPTAYVMREPGDTDYWSGLDDSGSHGYDLSVSVVLDTSYSMEHHTKQLSVAALSIRLACDELDIPCDVSTFNSVEGAVYRAGEQTTPYLVYANGGTEPAAILSMLDSQRHDKRRHLVLILTDGDWSDTPSLSPFGSPGRYFLLLGFGMYSTAILRNKNPNACVAINDLMRMPAEFTKSLAGFMA